MVYWLGILGAPTVFLAELSLAYALVPWACRSQHHAMLDTVSAIGLLLTVAALGAAFVGWRQARAHRDSPVAARQEFLGQMAIALSALSALAVIAQWATRLAVPPCAG
jgi:hypothetical protein